MKREIHVMCVIFLMLLISSCSNPKNSENKDGLELAKPATDYNEVFESVSLSDKSNDKLQRLTIEGSIIDTLEDDKILVKKNSDLVIYDISEKKETVLVKDMWNPVVSQKKDIIVYENDEGIHKVNVKDKKDKLIYELKEEASSNFIISQDSKSILLQTIKDDKFIMYLIDSNGKSREIKISDVEFTMKDFICLTEDKLFAFAESKKENGQVNEDELSDTTDLIMISLDSKEIKNITKLTSQDQVYLLDTYEDKLLIEIVENKINEESITSKSVIKRVNTDYGGLANTKIKVENSNILKILSDESEYIYLEQPSDRDVKYMDKMEIIVRSKKGIQNIGTINTDIPSKIFVQGDNILFQSNGDTYMISMLNR